MNTKVYFVVLGLVLGAVVLLQAETTSVSPSKPTATKPIATNISIPQTDLPATLHLINLTTSNNIQATTSATIQPTFVPKLCEQPRNDSVTMATSNGNIPVQFLQPNSVLVVQEKESADINCEVCATRPLPWTKVLWYKDGEPFENYDSDRIHIASLRHDNHEGLYKCIVVSPSNKTVSKLVTLIVNEDPLFSMVPSVWAKNVTFTQATKILWLVRGHRLFNSLKVTVMIRELGEAKWQYKREFTEFVSGSTELDDLEPSTIYIANVSAINSNGQKESRSIAFWSNGNNSTDFNDGVLNFGFCTRMLLGIITGTLGFLLSICAIYFCCVYPVCDFGIHQEYDLPLEQSNDTTSQKTGDQHKHNEEHDFDTDYMNMDFKNADYDKV